MDLRPLINRSLLIVAVTYGLLLALVSIAGLLGIWMGTLVFLSLWRYGYAVLRHVAQGRDEIAPPGIETMNPFGEFSLIAHFFLWLGSVLAVLSLSLGPGVLGGALPWVIAGLLLTAFPASAALMGLTGNLVYSLNPVNILRLAAALGRRYVLLLLALALLVVLSEGLQRLIVLQLNVLALLTSLVAVWTQLAVFALIGSAVHECHEDLDIPNVGESRDERLQRHEREDRLNHWQTTLDQAYGMISSREVGAAYQTLLKLVAEEGESLDIYQWLFDNTWSWQDKSHAVQIGRSYIGRLLDSNDKYAALDIFSRCRRVSPDFDIPPEQASVLAKFAQSIGRHGLADDLGQLVESGKRNV